MQKLRSSSAGRRKILQSLRYTGTVSSAGANPEFCSAHRSNSEDDGCQSAEKEEAYHLRDHKCEWGQEESRGEADRPDLERKDRAAQGA